MTRLQELRGVAAITVALALPALALQQVLHARSGEREGLDPLAHFLRDGAALLPVMACAVLAALLACRYLSGTRRLRAVACDATVFVPVMGFTAAAVVGLGVPAHDWLLAGREDLAGLGLGEWLAHMRHDGELTLAATMPSALAVSLWARFVPDLELRERLRRRPALAISLPLAALGATLLATTLAGSASAEDPPAPCPAGAPTKHFDVVAINVDIPLNRFGDHDTEGMMYALEEDVAAVREQERKGTVSIGMRDDAIQPLVIRANLGDCVRIDFRNGSDKERLGLHIDGLAFSSTSSGDAVGANTPSSADRGQSRSYTFFVPRDANSEGAHYMRPGLGHRQAVAHGLFGALVAEPAGSTYLHPATGQPIDSGWAAIIKQSNGKRSFREFTRLYHEVGDEDFRPTDAEGGEVRVVDPHTDAYRPSTRAIGYRSEPFMHRLEQAEHQKSLAYNSYTFGDPATPLMRSYIGEPTKLRLLHAGGEMFHVFHLHGGGIRWRANPVADKTFDYQATGLNKRPANTESPSSRLDSQAVGPGEAFNLEIEGGAGGVQQTVGDLLEHCHIAEHYNAGMWSFWRVFNTRQPDLHPLPDMHAPPVAVDSRGLLGRTMSDGTTLTDANIGSWLGALLPPRGVPIDDQDASVWDWKLDVSDPQRPLALGEPADTSSWPNLPGSGQPAIPGDELVDQRPVIRFNPKDGRPAFPLLRPNIGQRAPFAPRHSGAPFLGSSVNAAKTAEVDPYANRPDGLCPTGAPQRHFGISAIELPIQVTAAGDVDPTGMVFALDKDKAAIRAGTKPAEPLAIRSNLGDCVSVDFASETTDEGAFGGFTKNNIHIHHVQFDVQGSDGASAGYVFDQSVRPYQVEDVQLTAAAAVGATTIELTSAGKFRPGVWVAIGIGREGMEVHQVANVSGHTVRLTSGLTKAFPAGTWFGTEFARYEWYPDTAVDNVFWHDHVDGIHGWGKGLVAQLIVEPPGSTYHDPETGEQVDSGSIVDIHTSRALVPGLVDGSFREFALWTIDDNPTTDSTINLRAEPFADRGDDPSLLFSSHMYGDPFTPMPRAYAGDPFVIRTVNVSGNGIDTLHVDGHDIQTEFRFADADGARSGGSTDTVHYGVSERHTLALEGGAGGAAKRPGDYLYMNGIGRRFRQGAWGMMRVLGSQVDDLRPLPGTDVPTGGPALPTPSGQRPPEEGPGDPCPGGSPERSFDVTAVDLSGGDENGPDIRAAFVPTSSVSGSGGQRAPEPLVLHVAEGECIDVTLRNQRGQRASFHVAELERTPASSGVNVGYGPEQTVAPGGMRRYRYYAHSRKVGGALITDFGSIADPPDGMFGMVVVAPRGATFRHPESGRPTDIGSQVDVLLAGGGAYRDYSLIIADDDERIGENTMPYHADVEGEPSINYSAAPRFRDGDGNESFEGEEGPGTPLLRGYAGDPMQVHVAVAAGSEQGHVFGMGGMPWVRDPYIPRSNTLTAQGLAAWGTFDLDMIGGAGGVARAIGDYAYGDQRRPFTEAGLWGVVRVLGGPACTSLLPLPGLGCSGQSSLIGTPQDPLGGDTVGAAAGASRGPISTVAPTTKVKARRAAPRKLQLRSVRVRSPWGSFAVTMRLAMPDATRVVRVRMEPLGVPRAEQRRAEAFLAVGAGGSNVRVQWFPNAAARRPLCTGNWKLTVSAGPTKRTLAKPVVSTRVKVTGRRCSPT